MIMCWDRTTATASQLDFEAFHEMCFFSYSDAGTASKIDSVRILYTHAACAATLSFSADST